MTNTNGTYQISSPNRFNSPFVSITSLGKSQIQLIKYSPLLIYHFSIYHDDHEWQIELYEVLNSIFTSKCNSWPKISSKSYFRTIIGQFFREELRTQFEINLNCAETTIQPFSHEIASIPNWLCKKFYSVQSKHRIIMQYYRFFLLFQKSYYFARVKCAQNSWPFKWMQLINQPAREYL